MNMEEHIKELWPRGETPASALLFEQGAMMRAVKAALQRRAGISGPRLHVLGVLHAFGELSQAEIQRRLDVDGAAVTRLVKQLEVEGLLTRRVDPADNRFTLVTMTPEGKERLQEVGRTVTEFVAMSLEGVSAEELESMRRTMARVRANMEKM
jgi:DNA-binding MarR family transcriptional regulator